MIERGVFVVIVKVIEAVWWVGSVASVTWTVNVETPGAVGAPVIKPLVLSERPLGSGPDVKAQL